MLDEACWIDIRAGIQTEREAIKTNIHFLLAYYPEWRKDILGSEKELGKLVPNVVIYD